MALYPVYAAAVEPIGVLKVLLLLLLLCRSDTPVVFPIVPIKPFRAPAEACVRACVRARVYVRVCVRVYPGCVDNSAVCRRLPTVGKRYARTRRHGERKIAQRVAASRLAVPDQSRGNRE